MPPLQTENRLLKYLPFLKMQQLREYQFSKSVALVREKRTRK